MYGSASHGWNTRRDSSTRSIRRSTVVASRYILKVKTRRMAEETMHLLVQVEQETDNRFVADVADLPPSLLPVNFRAA